MFLVDGAAPKVGEVFRNPQMAAALEAAGQRRAGGVLSRRHRQAILKTSERLGGKMAAADLSEFQAEWVEPISTDYHGWKVYELPPNGQGIAALEMLNILSQFPLATYPPRGVEELHIADGSAEAGLCRPAPLRGRPALQQSAGGGHAFDGLRAPARQADRSRQGALRGAARATP